MARRYVDSNASGSGSGVDWTNAYATLQLALTAWVVGDEIWYAHDHAETYTSDQTLTCPNATSLDRVPLYRVNSGTDIYSPPPQDTSTTDNLSVTQFNGLITIDCNSVWYGLKTLNGGHFIISPDVVVSMYDCEITFGTTASGRALRIANDSPSEFFNCYFRNVIDTGSYIYFNGVAVAKFFACTFNFASDATGIIQPSNGISPSDGLFIDCDFSLCTSDILVDTSDFSVTADYLYHIFKFVNCKLRGSYTIGDGTMDAPNAEIILEGCSANGSTNYINRRLTNKGSTDTSISVYRSSGYIELAGSVNLSHSLTPSAKCIEHDPIRSSYISGVVESVGSKTFTVELIENFSTPLTQNNLWLELYYYDSATNTHHKLDSSSRQFAQLTYTDLVSGASLPAWTGEPVGSRSVKISVTVTVNKVGLYYGVVSLGAYEIGRIVHIDPLMSVT